MLIGIYATSISASMSSLIGASRILHALAQDDLFGALSPASLPSLEHALCVYLSLCLAQANVMLLFCLHRNDFGTSQGGVPRGEPLGSRAVFMGPSTGKPFSLACPSHHPKPSLGVFAGSGGATLWAGRYT